MSDLSDFVRRHAERGPCTCGQCVDSVKDAAAKQPTGHTADVVFFKVRARDKPDPDVLRDLCRTHEGEFGEMNPFDGEDHNYMQIGGWVGDQGLALMLMGLGSLLGLWEVVTPRDIFGKDNVDDKMQQEMAGAGYVFIRTKPKDATPEKTPTPAPAAVA